MIFFIFFDLQIWDKAIYSEGKPDQKLVKEM